MRTDRKKGFPALVPTTVIVRLSAEAARPAFATRARRRGGPAALVGAWALTALAAVTSARATVCPTVGKPFLGVEAPIFVDATCVDAGFNARNFVIDGVAHATLIVKGSGERIPYTRVDAHFNPTQTAASLPAGVQGSPTTVRQGVTWLFPAKRFWRHRFFQPVYPLVLSQSYNKDPTFAFTHGAYVVYISPGDPEVGYRVDAAAAKLAKAYADRLYHSRARIYGYVFGISGGSVQTMGALEGTTGVWDGAMPTSLATDGLPLHSFMWDALYALAVPPAQRAAIAAAVQPGSNTSIYAGLSPEQHAVLDELLNAGFARRALENGTFLLFGPLLTAGGLAALDPTYEHDFWSQPGYAGADPPRYLAAATVDGVATITHITRNAQHVPTGVTFDPATVPKLGSIGSVGLRFEVYRADGGHREVGALSGMLNGNRLTLTGGNFPPMFKALTRPSDPAVLEALAVGGKVRITNRYLLSLFFYPRHDIVTNGNWGYRQYLNADGRPKYPQRPVPAWMRDSIATQGGFLENGRIRFKAIIMENLLDPSSYPYTAAFYYSQIVKALGREETHDMVRIYYNDNADHADLGAIKGAEASYLVGFGGIWNQALLDLVRWVEKGVPPPPSTRYSVDAHNQVSVPPDAAARGGLQPVVTLTVNGTDRAVIAVNQPVTLIGRIQAPPGTGKILQYDWYLGDSPVAYGVPTVLLKPQSLVNVARSMSFSKPGAYEVTLRATSQRNGVPDRLTSMQNLARVRVMVQ